MENSYFFADSFQEHIFSFQVGLPKVEKAIFLEILETENP